MSKPTHYIKHITVIALSFFVSISTAYGNSANLVASLTPQEEVTDKIINTKVNPETIAEIADYANAPIEVNQDVLGNDLPSLNSSFSFSANNSVDGSFSLENSGTERGKVTPYKIEDGDTLWSIANKFSVTTSTIKWANNLADENSIKPGQDLLIPAISGTLHRVKAGETLPHIASLYNASTPQIIEENGLLDETVQEGLLLVVPGGTIKEAPKPVPKPQPGPQKLAAVSKNSKTASVKGKRVGYGGSGNKFPGGWCTSYVASRRSIPWRGNAGAWLGNARSMGFATGRSPQAGAIIVTTESPVGHVGLVESVNGDSVTISEMNYVGRGRISRRTISNGSGFIRGYIY